MNPGVGTGGCVWGRRGPRSQPLRSAGARPAPGVLLCPAGSRQLRCGGGRGAHARGCDSPPASGAKACQFCVEIILASSQFGLVNNIWTRRASRTLSSTPKRFWGRERRGQRRSGEGTPGDTGVRDPATTGPAHGVRSAPAPRPRPLRAALETHAAASLMFRGDRAPTTLAQARAVSTLLNLEFAAGDHAGAAGRHSGGLCDASRKPSPFSTDTPCPPPPGLWRELTPHPSPGATLSSGPGFSPGTAGQPGLRKTTAHLSASPAAHLLAAVTAKVTPSVPAAPRSASEHLRPRHQTENNPSRSLLIICV